MPEQSSLRPIERTFGHDEPRGPERFFVQIEVGRRHNVRRLASMSLDLHGQSGLEGSAAVGGLLTLEEVARVVRAGYRVTVEADADTRAHGRNVIEFDTWLAAQEADLGPLGEG